MKKNVGKRIPQMLVDIRRIVRVETDNCSLNHTLSQTEWLFNLWPMPSQKNNNADGAPS